MRLLSSTDAVAQVVTALEGRPGTRWVGIDGKGASGKTTLARLVAAAVDGAVTVQVDDFARPDLTGWDRDRFLAQVFRPLVAGRAARYQRWDWGRNAGAEWVSVPPGQAMVVEGVSATDVRLGVPWDVTVWVEAPPEVRQRRALERDGPEMLDRWLTDWMPSEDSYEAQQRPQQRAHLLVDGTAG